MAISSSDDRSGPEFILRPGELRHAVSGELAVRAHEEVLVHRPGPAMVQHIAAVRDALDPEAP